MTGVQTCALPIAKRYAAEQAKRGTAKRYLKHPAGWLRSRKWEDEPEPDPDDTRPPTNNGHATRGFDHRNISTAEECQEWVR